MSTNAYTCLIIDDEVFSRAYLAELIQQQIPELRVVGTASGIETGIEAIRLYQPDILLLDIRLGKSLSFDILAATADIPKKVIFISAYQEYAIKAFKYSAVDYLLKPVDTDELKKAIQRIVTAQGDAVPGADQFSQLKTDLVRANVLPQKIFVPDRNGYHGIEISKIHYIESDGSYTKIYTDEGEILVSKNMKYLESLLTEQNTFIRVHRSYLVNAAKVQSIIKGTPGTLVLYSGIKIPVSKNSWDEVLKIMGIS